MLKSFLNEYNTQYSNLIATFGTCVEDKINLLFWEEIWFRFINSFHQQESYWLL